MKSDEHGHVSNKDAFLEASHPELMVPFSIDEYKLRWKRLRTKMEEEGLTALFLSAPESICYVSGHQSTWYQGQAPTDWYPGSGVARVEFQVARAGSDALETITSLDAAPWKTRFATTDLSDGVYSLRVLVRDRAGNELASVVRSTTVRNADRLCW